ncbi:c-type cytochrome [Parahaliea mediterranea]|uniref:C-type cytochrome n=1 Tax=Parahaliea mediterranea TaxID=651086 RepID=A0A939IP15_9GAMM|nr:c-type cytochrome [Parahaliea mediterranea]MBN7799125.1 c-type cytochrome [Parahaliea mediterranea]
MRLSILILLACLSALAARAHAEADLARGESLYATCASCHGADAGGNRALSAPRLSHLREVTIVAQLEKFRAGQRGGEGATASARQMAPMAATLPDEQALLDVAAYIATLDSPVSPATVEGDPALGADYYNQFCGACHGPGAAGNVALNSPALAGGDDWYLVAQLQAFRAGERGAQSGDRTGRQMRAMAAVLPSEQAVADVVAFIRSLSEGE